MADDSENPWPWKEPPKPRARGAFIVIEGLDRAGKTTQVKRLCEHLYASGHNIVTIRFPGITPVVLICNFVALSPKLHILLRFLLNQHKFIQTEHPQSAK